MKTNGKFFLQVILFLLILLWVYAASSKLMQFGLFRAQMHLQVLPPLLRTWLPYFLPPLEILAAAVLLFDTTRPAGLYLSFLLLLAFSVYVGLAVFKLLDNVPCSCGGVFNNIGWKAHLALNLFFLLLTATGIYIDNRERRAGET